MCDFMAFVWACVGFIGLIRGSWDFWMNISFFFLSALYAVAGGLRKGDKMGEKK